MLKKTTDLKGTYELAVLIAGQIKAGDVLLLYGGLASGKTTFTKSLAQALGVKENVSSPTFTIMAEYRTNGHEVIKELVHADLYRLKKIDATSLASLEEILTTAKDAGRAVVIEWAERLGNNAPYPAWKLKFDYGENKNDRIIEVTYHQEKFV